MQHPNPEPRDFVFSATYVHHPSSLLVLAPHLTPLRLEINHLHLEIAGAQQNWCPATQNTTCPTRWVLWAFTAFARPWSKAGWTSIPKLVRERVPSDITHFFFRPVQYFVSSIALLLRQKYISLRLGHVFT